MAILTKKQAAQLNEMGHNELIDIIYFLVEKNKDAKKELIKEYLLSSNELVVSVEKEYAKQSKRKRFYDYYEADQRFQDLKRDIAEPLLKASTLAGKETEQLCVKIMLEFEVFSEHTDTSSGSWLEYFKTVQQAWLNALATQHKKSEPTVIAKKVFDLLTQVFYWDTELIKSNRALLGTEVYCLVRDMFFENGETDYALEISVMIRDLDFLTPLLKNATFDCYDRFYLDYARLLIDELRADEAIIFLHKLDKKGLRYNDKYQWHQLLIKSLIEDGQKEEAKNSAIDAFKVDCHSIFYKLYNEASIDDDTNLFLKIANEKGMKQLITFASDIDRYDVVDETISTASQETLVDLLSKFTSASFIRTLSSTLYKHGYALSAVILRRLIAEKSISKGNAKYYSYAASDLKKSVDYSQ